MKPKGSDEIIIPIRWNPRRLPVTWHPIVTVAYVPCLLLFSREVSATTMLVCGFALGCGFVMAFIDVSEWLYARREKKLRETY
jgi:hypothetical protein